MTSLTEQQKKAVETIDRHVLVSAGAGSGKTHVLVERYVELLKQHPQYGVTNLVAVTFTRKAAAEMRTRLKTRFSQLMDSTESSERERWASCVAEIDSARIGTIHSLCESILRAFATDAKIDPQFEVLDELMQAQLLTAASEQAFREVMQESQTERSLLFDFALDEIKRLVTQALRSSLQLAEAIAKFPEDNPPKLKEHIRDYLRRIRQMCLNDLLRNPEWREAVAFINENRLPEPGNKLASYSQELTQCAEEIAAVKENGEPTDTPDTKIEGAWQALIAVANLSPGNFGGTGDLAKSIRQNLRVARDLAKDFTKRLPLNLSEEDDLAFQYLSSFVALAKRALSIYQSEKRARLMLDYNDLIELAHLALTKENSLARRYYHDNIRAILIDEFQDTNTIQSKLLVALAGQRSKFFFIGDGKQSIYRFQGADVGTFNYWRRHFADSDEATTLSLNASFRSHPAIVQFVNLVFAKLMVGADVNTAHRAAFERLHAANQTKSSDDRVEIIIFEQHEIQPELQSQPPSQERKNSRPAPSAIEARSVAAWIEEKLASGQQIFDKTEAAHRPINFGDFAVLVQRNNDLIPIENALRQRHIPYVLLGGKGFLERQEIFDFENLLRFVSAPSDDHALLGLLRSPIVALTDDVIHRLVVGEDSRPYASLWGKLQMAARQSASSSELTKDAVVLLKQLIAESSVLPLSRFLRRVIAETNYDLVLLSLPHGKQRSRNLWKLVSLAEENEHLTCSEFARDLNLMREYRVKQADAPVDTGNTVKLMTIHASKGLEFPLVALPALSTNAISKKDRLLFNREYGLAFNSGRTDEDITPTWYQAAKLLDDDMDIAERKRLFYVAMTRAKDHLAFFVESGGKEKHSFRSWLAATLELDLSEGAEDREWKTVTSASESARFVICKNTSLLSRPRTAKLVAASGEDSPFSENTAAESKTIAEAKISLVTDENGQFKFLFSPSEAGAVDRQDRSRLPEKPALKREDVEQAELDLLEPIAAIPLRLPSAWQGLVRVSNKRNGEIVIAKTTMGTFFHALMEHLPSDDRPLTKEEIEDVVFTQHNIVPTVKNRQFFVNEGQRLLDLFYGSELFSLFKRTKRRWHEIPYLVIADGQGISRRPDLLLESDQGEWHLIDFKTDHFDPADITKQTKLHSEQLHTYVHELSRLLAVSMTAHIYYAQHALLVELQEYNGWKL